MPDDGDFKILTTDELIAETFKGLRAGRVPQAWPLNDTDARVEERSWSPNRIGLTVHSTQGVRVAVNQNYDAGWRLERGPGKVLSAGGLLAVEVPPGDHELTLRYLPPSVIAGTVAMGALLLLWVALLISSRMRKRFPSA